MAEVRIPTGPLLFFRQCESDTKKSGRFAYIRGILVNSSIPTGFLWPLNTGFGQYGPIFLTRSKAS